MMTNATIPAPGQTIDGDLRVTGVTTDNNSRHGKHYKVRAEFGSGPFEGQSVLIVQPIGEAKDNGGAAKPKPARKRATKKATTSKARSSKTRSSKTKTAPAKTTEEELEDL
jgi:hypothetical protein